MVIDHIGIVVPSLEQGIQQWEELFGYTRASESVENCRQKVRVVFLSKEGSLTVKLIEPADPASPVSMLANKGADFITCASDVTTSNVRSPDGRRREQG